MDRGDSAHHRRRIGRTADDELGCDWHTINDAVIAYGEALLEADVDRVGDVDALGLDETLFNRTGRWRTQQWCTSVVNLRGPTGAATQLIDVVAGRSAARMLAWLDEQPETWKWRIRYGVLDMSGPYRKVFTDGLGYVRQVADPFHVVKLANSKLDECRRRVQNEIIGHRGRKADPLYRARRLLTKAHERLDDRGEAKLRGLLAARRPPRRSPHRLARQGNRPWLAHITAWYEARVTNGPTEAVNNLIKRIKRIGFGFRRHHHYRIRALLYAGRPNWALLATIKPR